MVKSGKVPKPLWFYASFIASSQTNPSHCLDPNKQLLVTFCAAIRWCFFPDAFLRRFHMRLSPMPRCANWKAWLAWQICLADLAKNFDLQITNDDGHHDPNKATWTFCSCMGVRRRIDFILCSMSFSLLQSFATDDVDLGSDHRAVYCLLNLPKHTKQQSKKRKFKTKKRWKPKNFEPNIGTTKSYNITRYREFDIECSGARKTNLGFCRCKSNQVLGRPEFPTTIATKEGQPMPTRKDGGVKTNSETYQETFAGTTQFANGTHFGRICSTQPFGWGTPWPGQTTQKIQCRKTTNATDVCGIFAGHIRTGLSRIKFAAICQEWWWRCQCSVVLDGWVWLCFKQDEERAMRRQWWAFCWNVQIRKRWDKTLSTGVVQCWSYNRAIGVIMASQRVCYAAKIWEFVRNQQLATYSYFENCLQNLFFVIASTVTSPVGLPTVCGPSRF